MDIIYVYYVAELVLTVLVSAVIVIKKTSEGE